MYLKFHFFSRNTPYEIPDLAFKIILNYLTNFEDIRNLSEVCPLWKAQIYRVSVENLQINVDESDCRYEEGCNLLLTLMENASRISRLTFNLSVSPPIPSSSADKVLKFLLSSQKFKSLKYFRWYNESTGFRLLFDEGANYLGLDGPTSDDVVKTFMKFASFWESENEKLPLMNFHNLSSCQEIYIQRYPIPENRIESQFNRAVM